MMRLNLPVIADAADYENHFNHDVWRYAAAIICARHNLSSASLRRSQQGENIIFFVDRRFVIKIFAPFRQSPPSASRLPHSRTIPAHPAASVDPPPAV